MSTDNPLPTSYYPSIILGSDNNVFYAIDPGTGKKNWEYSLPNVTNPSVNFMPSPLIYNDRVYIATPLSDTIYKLNAKTGTLVTKLVLPLPSTVQATPIADGKLLYVATMSDTLYAVDTGTGAVKWRFGAANDLSAFVASPVIYNNNIYVASVGVNPLSGQGGHVYCIDKVNGPDPTTGYPIWDWPGWGLNDSASFISSPSISYPYVYIGSAVDSNLYALNMNPPILTPAVVPTSGLEHWRFKTMGNIKSSPTAYAGRCFVGSNDFFVYAVDSQTGAQVWKFRTNSQVNSSPIISNQVIYIGSYDYNLYAINAIDGSQKWRFTTKGLIKSSPLPYNGRVYVGSYDGYLYAVDSAFGVQQWSFKINGNIQCSPAIDDYSGKQYNSGISGYNTSGNNN